MKRQLRKKSLARGKKTRSIALAPKSTVGLDEHGKPKRIPPFWSFGPVAKDLPRFTPIEGTPYWTVNAKIGGVAPPPDLDEAIRAHGGDTFLWIFDTVEDEPWRFFNHYPINSEDRYTSRFLGGNRRDDSAWETIDLGDPATWKRDERGLWQANADFGYSEWMIVHAAINTAMAQGFFLALTRYADDLKSSVEASAILEGLKKGRKKGTETTKRKAEPRRMAVRRRFRALRKSGFNKGDARGEIQQEYRLKGEEISVRQLERYTEGLS